MLVKNLSAMPLLLLRTTALALAVLLAGCKEEAPPAAPNSPPIPFDTDRNRSADLDEINRFYESLAANSALVQLRDIGYADAGLPLREVVITRGNADPAAVRAAGKLVVMVNNGIHPGEPCGIDASMLLARDLVQNAATHTLLDRIALVIMPVYNIGGALNRGSHSRVNQNGPAAYGFRGNEKNLDLNRDFIKCDSRNAQSFNRWFAEWMPELFFDTHTSNGADYQHVMTLIETQRDKLEAGTAAFMAEKITPALYAAMADEGYPMTPYVYSRGTPDQGIYGFIDLPRYSSGYAALHHTIAYTTEAHMLKPFEERVMATLAILRAGLDIADKHRDEWLTLRSKAREACLRADSLAIDWNLDTERRDSFRFMGFEADYLPSTVTGAQRLKYYRSRPYTRHVPWWPHYRSSRKVRIPKAYILPQAYTEVVQRLRWNGVQMRPLPNDTDLVVRYYYIDDLKSPAQPYEGHFLHRDVQARSVTTAAHFRKGDWYIPTEQNARNFLVNVLEPQAPDSYFAWNFFDAILQQKEYFSAYVFEDLAAEYLSEDPDLREKFDRALATEPGLREDPRRQLEFIYRHTLHYETTHRRYPVARVEYETTK